MFGASRLALYAANPVAGSTGASYFAGGYVDNDGTGSQRTNTIKKYALSTATVTQLTATLQQKLDGTGAAGNQTQGMFAGGGQTNSVGAPSTYNSKLDFSTDSMTTVAVVASQRYGRGGSSSTNGFLFAGQTTSGYSPTNNANKYSYSGNSWTNFTTLGFTTTRQAGGCHSSSTASYIYTGTDSTAGTTYTDSRAWTFSSDTSSAGFTLNAGRFNFATTGDPTRCVLMSGQSAGGGFTLVVENYVMSSGTRATAASLTYGWNAGDAAGDDTYGIFTAGYSVSAGGTLADCQKKYTYSSDTYASTTSIRTTVCAGPGACCSTQTS